MSKHKKRQAAIERQKLGPWFPGARWEPRNDNERRMALKCVEVVENLCHREQINDEQSTTH